MIKLNDNTVYAIVIIVAVYLLGYYSNNVITNYEN